MKNLRERQSPPCPQQLTEGRCTILSCPKNHRLDYYCKICNIICESRLMLASHTNSEQHLERYRRGQKAMPCAPCNRIFLSMDKYHEHQCGLDTEMYSRPSASVESSSAGLSRSATAPSSEDSELTQLYDWLTLTPTPPPQKPSTGSTICPTCNSLHVSKRQYNLHTASPEHLLLAKTAVKQGQPPRPPSNYRQCIVCDIPIFLDCWDVHITQKSHKKAIEKSPLQATIRATERSQRDINISPAQAVDFGVLDCNGLKGPTHKKDVSATVTSDADVVFLKAELVPKQPWYVPLFRLTTESAYKLM